MTHLKKIKDELKWPLTSIFSIRIIIKFVRPYFFCLKFWTWKVLKFQFILSFSRLNTKQTEKTFKWVRCSNLEQGNRSKENTVICIAVVTIKIHISLYVHLYWKNIIYFSRHTDLIILHKFGFLSRSTSDGHKHHNMFPNVQLARFKMIAQYLENKLHQLDINLFFIW